LTAQASDADSTKTCAAQPPNALSNNLLSLRELALIVLGNLRLLVAVPVLAGLVAFGVTSFLPKWYVSVAYLSLDASGARAADAVMRSPRVLDAVIAAIGDPPEAREARAKSLDRNRRIVAAPGELQATSKLFRLEYSDRDPHVAQKINSVFISSWLEATTPSPGVRSSLGVDIGLSEARLNAISKLLDQIQKNANALAPKNLNTELAASVRDLLESNLRDFAAIIAWNRALYGVSRNVVASEPSLPKEPSWPKKSVISILTAFVAGMLALVFVLMRSWRRTRID
jgi:uncharacterized protein involved in exopolysaccharide biosynthesis